MVNLNRVIVLDHTSVVQFFVDLILAQGMLYVIILYLIAPAIIEVMNLASDFSAVL